MWCPLRFVTLRGLLTGEATLLASSAQAAAVASSGGPPRPPRALTRSPFSLLFRILARAATYVRVVRQLYR